MDLTDAEISDFLGNIDLHIIAIKFHWQNYLTSTDPTVQAAEKAAALDSLNNIQMILNTISPPLAITLPTEPLSDTAIVQYGIMSEEEVNTVTPMPAPQPAPAPTPTERTPWQKKHGLA